MTVCPHKGALQENHFQGTLCPLLFHTGGSKTKRGRWGENGMTTLQTVLSGWRERGRDRDETWGLRYVILWFIRKMYIWLFRQPEYFSYILGLCSRFLPLCFPNLWNFLSVERHKHGFYCVVGMTFGMPLGRSAKDGVDCQWRQVLTRGLELSVPPPPHPGRGEGLEVEFSLQGSMI